jgi:hypothetical protein
MEGKIIDSVRLEHCFYSKTSMEKPWTVFDFILYAGTGDNSIALNLYKKLFAL